MPKHPTSARNVMKLRPFETYKNPPPTNPIDLYIGHTSNQGSSVNERFHILHNQKIQGHGKIPWGDS